MMAIRRTNRKRAGAPRRGHGSSLSPNEPFERLALRLRTQSLRALDPVARGAPKARLEAILKDTSGVDGWPPLGRHSQAPRGEDGGGTAASDRESSRRSGPPGRPCGPAESRAVSRRTRLFQHSTARPFTLLMYQNDSHAGSAASRPDEFLSSHAPRSETTDGETSDLRLVIPDGRAGTDSLKRNSIGVPHPVSCQYVGYIDPYRWSQS